MIQMLKRFITKPMVVAFFGAGMLVGCASSVPLNGQTPGSAAGTGTGTGAAATASSVITQEIAAARSALERVEPSVYFDFDSFVVKPEYQNTVNAFANYLRADPKARLVIEGNADERGTTEYNLALGQKRAEAVARALGIMGIAEGRVEAISNGEEKPRAQGSNEEAWAKNRRADLLIR